MSTTSFTRRLASLALAATACAHLGAGANAGADAGGGPVRLRFAWPPGFDASVIVAHESRQSGTDRIEIVARQRLRLERRGDELRVLTRDIQARGNDPDLETSTRINEALVQVVTPDGKLRRVDGVDEALAVLHPADAEARERARLAFVRSTSFDWELLVGAWAGEALAIGEVHRKQVTAYVPDLIDVEARLDVEYALEGRVPCTEEETARRCVELSYRARIAPEDRAAVVERIRRLATKPDDPVPEDVHGELEVILVTEPDTLVPHRMSQREQRRLRLVFPDGRVLETEGRSEDAAAFSPAPHGPPGGPGPDGSSREL